MPELLLQWGAVPEFFTRPLPAVVISRPSVCLSSDFPVPWSDLQSQMGQGHIDSNWLRHFWLSDQLFMSIQLPIPWSGWTWYFCIVVRYCSQIPSLHLTVWILCGLMLLSETVLNRFKKSSYKTGNSLLEWSGYSSKWKQFSLWTVQHFLGPNEALMPMILDYILHLKQTGLALSSLKFHHAAVSVSHAPLQSYLVFSQLIVSRFLNGLCKTAAWSQCKDIGKTVHP